MAIASETTAFFNINYEIHSYPRYKDILAIDATGVTTHRKSRESLVFCPFLHVYFDFPISSHYVVYGEVVRERCGTFLAKDDDVDATLTMGVADSGIPHGHGYAKGRMELATTQALDALHRFDQGDIDLDQFKTTLRDSLAKMAPLRRSVKVHRGLGSQLHPTPTMDPRHDRVL